MRPPGPLHSRMQVGARFNSLPTPTLGSTAVNNGDIVSPPPLPPRAVTKARAAAAEPTLFIAGQMETKWPFMSPKDPIVIGRRMHESARIFTGGYLTFL